MIRFRFGIASPFKTQDFVSWFSRDWTVSKNKMLELQLYKYSYDLFSTDLNLCWWGRDHAGPEFELNVFGVNFRIALTDRRHWNMAANTWENYDD